MCVTCWKVKDECKCFCPPFKIDSYETEQEAIKLNKDNLPYQQIEDIDDLMYPILCVLHSKGYETSYCCSGHPDRDGMSTAISFDKEYNFPIGPPQEFKCRNRVGRTFIEYSIPYYKCKKLSLESRINLINKLNSELLEWANNLPSIDGK